jgi:hypothetical protein
MPKTLQLRRGTTAEITANTPASGELFVDTQKKTVTVGDGSTAGGIILARDDRVSHVYNTANTVTSGFLANTIIIANSSGYLSSTSNLAVLPGDSYGFARIIINGPITNAVANGVILSQAALSLKEGNNYTNNEKDLQIVHSGLVRRRVHSGLTSPSNSSYGGINTYEEVHLYANTSNATITYAGADGQRFDALGEAGTFGNGEFGIFETTIMAQSHGAAGSNSFDGTRFWKYETTFSRTPATLLSNSTLTFSSNTGNSGSWIANVNIVHAGTFNTNICDIAVQGEAGKNIFWYVVHTQKSLQCTFAAGGGGGGGK